MADTATPAKTVPDDLQRCDVSQGMDISNDEVDAAARHADMRVQVVLREINQGALEGFGYQSQISEYAARLVIAALDDFDYRSLQTAWGDGFRAGVAFEQVRRQGRD